MEIDDFLHPGLNVTPRIAFRPLEEIQAAVKASLPAGATLVGMYWPRHAGGAMIGEVAGPTTYGLAIFSISLSIRTLHALREPGELVEERSSRNCFQTSLCANGPQLGRLSGGHFEHLIPRSDPCRIVRMVALVRKMATRLESGLAVIGAAAEL